MKKQLGQFFTTNSQYILQGFEKYMAGKEVTDPFAGNKDLIYWAINHKAKKATGFDVDERYIDNKTVFLNDSLNNIKKYKFVIANPPYLHKNKADLETKENFFKGLNGHFEDLYQISINSVLDSEEGILIVPLNFLSAENSKKIRELFFIKFRIVELNIFTQKVFNDTTYNVVSFYYKKRKDFSREDFISATIFPRGIRVEFVLKEKCGWRLGGDFFEKINSVKNNLNIFRLTEDFLEQGGETAVVAVQELSNKQIIKITPETKRKLEKNILFLRAIDSKNGKKIQLEDIRNYDVFGLVGKNTSRNLAHLIFGRDLPINDQEYLMKVFNEELAKNREEYFSFFLTNFRDNNRKRISFDFTYKFLNFLYEQKNEKQSSLF